jgi:hypothetical protein
MAAAPAEPNGTSIEALFRPSTRFRDSHPHVYLPEGYTEVELLPGLSLENIRATRILWNALHSFARHKIVWMTPDVYVCHDYLDLLGGVLFLHFKAEGDCITLRFMQNTADAAATATCDFLVRLFATCEERDLRIIGSSNPPPSLSGAALSLFFQESRSCLRQFTLQNMVLREDLCLALATMSRLDVELNVHGCCLPNGVAGAFVECLQSDRGPVKLGMCPISSQILANALTGDSRVTTLRPYFDEADDAEKAIVFRALANNRGLVHLELGNENISDENWTIMCHSLQAHLTLTSLGLCFTIDLPAMNTRPANPAGAAITLLADERKTRRTRVLAEMIKKNTVLHTIRLAEGEYDQQVCTEEIRPYLVTNLYRPRVLAVKKTKNRPFREKVLGRAVYSVRSNPNLVWMLLSENVDAFVRSEEEEEESNSEVPVAVAVAAGAVLAVAGSKRKR